MWRIEVLKQISLGNVGSTNLNCMLKFTVPK
jgi:hypothetical protein